MNSTHTHNGHAVSQGLENTSKFRGILTKLLHEAFYLEDDFIHRSACEEESDFLASEPEEDCDQMSFIHQFLKLRT